MKKALAILLIIIAGILSLTILGQIPNYLRVTGDAIRGGGQELGFLFGLLTFTAVEMVVIFFCMKYGLRWLKKPVVKGTMD